MKKLKAFVIATLLLGTSSVYAQDRAPHEVYSMMVYNFTKYVQWPDHSGSGQFVIAVVGNSEIYKTLNDWYGGKSRGSKIYTIKAFNAAKEITEDCHVIYIDKAKNNEFEAINSKIRGKGTLVITDKSGMGIKGSAINFKTVDNKLKFELNQKVIEECNLKVSSALSSMAILI